MTDKDIMGMEMVSCREFGEQYTRGILLTEYPLTIMYQNVSMADADKNWHTPSVVLYSSDDGRAVEQGSTGLSNHYREYCTTRSDAYGMKSLAEAYQYESQHLSDWNSWEEWLEKNKRGTTCTVMAVRYRQYVRIRLENAGVVVSATVTLPEHAGENVYFALTGERCTLSDFVPMRDTEPIGEGAIIPVSVQKSTILKTEGDFPNLDCPGWWTAHSEGIEITEEPIVITYDSISYQQAKESWHTPFIVLFSALDRNVNGVAYTEYSVTRSDAYGWKENADDFSYEADFSDEWSSWEEWLSANKKGVKCSLTAVRNGDTIILTQENGGVMVTSYMDIPRSTALPVCFALSGELCSISNIKKAE